jgi:tetratricopeptide (TPR) repeat protein
MDAGAEAAGETVKFSGKNFLANSVAAFLTCGMMNPCHRGAPILCIFLAGLSPFLGQAQKNETPPAVAGGETADLTPMELIKAGRAAFEAQEFAKAEQHFDQLIADYGENAEVAALVDECRPLLAMCKVKAKAFDDAVTLIDASLQLPKLPDAAREELQFWRGICLLQTGEVTTAQEQFGEYYANERHDRTRRYEAFLLFGTGYIQLDDFEGASDFFSDQIPKLPPDQTEVAGRATVLLLHSLMEAGRLSDAVQLVRRTFSKLDDLTQAVSFQLLTLSLGARCLEEEKYYDAIVCLNRLWPRERLLQHQQAKLDAAKQRRELLRKEGAKREALVFQTDGIIARIERELEQFAKIESYDAALKLRLAQAFIGLERWREAGMILDDAVATLEPDPTVEQAGVTALECWQQTGDWERVIASADRYLSIYAEHRRGDHLPQILTARGEGLRSTEKYVEAEKEFGDVANDWPQHPLAPRAMLLAGICQLERGRSDIALTAFEALRRRFKKGPLHEDAMFWEGMALSLERKYDEARARLTLSLESYPNGRYAASGAFERARCLHNQMKHREAAAEFRAWLKKFPGDRQENEARLLLAESLMADGEMDAGIKMLRGIPREDAKLWEEAQFKVGEALRKLGRSEQARKFYELYIKENPRSRRLAEAAMWQAREVQKLGQPQAARDLVWATLEKHGDDPKAEGVEDLLDGMAKLYRGEAETRVLFLALEEKAAAAKKDNRRTLALRLSWAEGNALRASSPVRARTVHYNLASLVDPAIHHPRIIADTADALRAGNDSKRARELYLDLRKWQPRALERERAAFGLGMIAAAAGDKDKALEWFERCVAESLTGAAGNDAQLERGTLLRSMQRPKEAVEALTAVTTNRLATSQQKARALLALGYLAREAIDLPLAAKHFQRCYLSGAKWKDTAAEARLQHGLVLEKMNDQANAVRTYKELLAKNELASLPPAKEARERLAKLEGGGL